MTPPRRFAGRLRYEFQVYCGNPAAALVGLQFVDDPLALTECADPGPLKRRGVDKDVLAASGRLNEAVIVPFHLAFVHKMSFQYGMHVRTGTRPSGSFDIFGGASLNVRPAISWRTGLVVRPNLDAWKVVVRMHFSRLSRFRPPAGNYRRAKCAGSAPLVRRTGVCSRDVRTGRLRVPAGSAEAQIDLPQ